MSLMMFTVYGFIFIQLFSYSFKFTGVNSIVHKYFASAVLVPLVPPFLSGVFSFSVKQLTDI